MDGNATIELCPMTWDHTILCAFVSFLTVKIDTSEYGCWRLSYNNTQVRALSVVEYICEAK